MFLSGVLSKAGYPPNRIETTAKVHLGRVDDAPAITKIQLDCQADVPGVDEETFSEQVEASKTGCPVSKALAGVQISVNAKLTN